MAAQAGVVSASQVTVPNGPSASMSSFSVSKPSTWAWVWFIASVLFLVSTYLGRRGRSE